MSNKDITEGVVKAQALELKSGHKYLLLCDSNFISRDTVNNLTKALNTEGFRSIAVMVSGDPNVRIKILEEKE